MHHQVGKIRLIVTTALCVVAMPQQAWSRPVLAAGVVQDGSRPSLPSCTVDDENSMRLGSFPNDADAISAARGRLRSGQYGLASIAGEEVVITSGGTVYGPDVCVGSGMGQRQPKQNKKTR